MKYALALLLLSLSGCSVFAPPPVPLLLPPQSCLEEGTAIPDAQEDLLNDNAALVTWGTEWQILHIQCKAALTKKGN